MPISLSLPDGRSVSLDATTEGKILAGIVFLSGVEVREEPAVWTEIETVSEAYCQQFEGMQPSQIEGLGEARRLYKSFGQDPSRHRPSSEALLRRVLNHKGLYRLNNAVDTCNLASLTFLLPIGMYDLDLVHGDVVLRAGRPGEEYAGIRKGPVHLEGRLALFDDVSGFGSPTSDSARTCVTEATRNLLAVIMATSQYDASRMERHTEHFAALFTSHCGAAIEATGILGE